MISPPRWPRAASVWWKKFERRAGYMSESSVYPLAPPPLLARSRKHRGDRRAGVKNSGPRARGGVGIRCAGSSVFRTKPQRQQLRTKVSSTVRSPDGWYQAQRGCEFATPSTKGGQIPSPFPNSQALVKTCVLFGDFRGPKKAACMVRFVMP